jgi:hypothetical protein
MKRTLNVLLTVSALALALGACKKKEEAPPADPAVAPNPTEAPAPTPTPAPEATPPADPAAAPAPAADPAKPAEAQKPAEGAAADDAKLGIDACDKYLERFAKCDKMPEQAKQAFQQSMAGHKQNIQSGGEEAKKAVTQACEQATAAWEQSLKSMGC